MEKTEKAPYERKKKRPKQTFDKHAADQRVGGGNTLMVYSSVEILK